MLNIFSNIVNDFRVQCALIVNAILLS